MFVIWVEFVIKADHIDAFHGRVLRQAQDSLAKEPGCRVFDVCVDPEDPAKIFLYEVYDTAADFDAHLASGHFRDFDAETADWTLSKQVRKLNRFNPPAL